ncbi:MAG: IS110 family transposase [Acidobacteria bacterium]|nr:MAG: IS110 family transposase [Acidobacteriota bacterium]
MKGGAMRVIRKRCLGLDLHKKQNTAYLRVHLGSDQEPVGVTQQFGTMPEDLERLRQWIVEQQVTDVVMESTGVYWMHLYELLEGVTQPAVVNASHVKKVPGRKTDVSDAAWLAELHAHGLLRVSFVPPKPIRELRAVTRYRAKLVAIRTAAKNRTIKLIEMAGVKLSSVASDSFGKTGRIILDGLCEQTPDISLLAGQAKGKLRNKIPALEQALRHPLSTQQRELLKMHLHTYDMIDSQVAQTELRISSLATPYAAALARLDAIPGINAIGAVTLLAETGADMSVYRSDRHLTAMAGLAPGNAISSDKRRRISVRKGNHHLKRICVQIAWAASRTKDSFLRVRFMRLQSRIGRNKALVALARQILVIVYHVLSTDRPYSDLGPNFYDARNKERAVQRHLKKLSSLGFMVTLTKKST